MKITIGQRKCLQSLYWVTRDLDDYSTPLSLLRMLTRCLRSDAIMESVAVMKRMKDLNIPPPPIEFLEYDWNTNHWPMTGEDWQTAYLDEIQESRT